MSITVTYSTIDHRYFMRRTKSEIIRRIEEMQGRQFDFSESFKLLHKTKDELASEAMRLVRALPPPPDPADTLVQVMTTELRRQSYEEGTFMSDDSSKPIVDGLIDLRQLAQAILKSGVLTL